MEHKVMKFKASKTHGCYIDLHGCYKTTCYGYYIVFSPCIVILIKFLKFGYKFLLDHLEVTYEILSKLDSLKCSCNFKKSFL